MTHKQNYNFKEWKLKKERERNYEAEENNN